jgi:hypothetical protein
MQREREILRLQLGMRESRRWQEVGKYVEACRYHQLRQVANAAYIGQLQSIVS